MRLLVYLALISLIFAMGCSSRIAFTQELRQKYSLTKGQLRQLQFYLDGDIILKRKLDSDKVVLAKGTLKTESGKLIDEILVKDGTPGIVSFGGPYWLAVSFEKDEVLIFTSRLGKIAEGNYHLGTLGARRINYGSNTYICTNQSLGALLEIDKDTLFNIVEQSKTLPGQTLQDREEEKKQRQRMLLYEETRRKVEAEKKEEEAKKKREEEEARILEEEAKKLKEAEKKEDAKKEEKK